MIAIMYLKNIEGQLLEIGKMKWPDMEIEKVPKVLKFDVDGEFIKKQAQTKGTPLDDVHFPKHLSFVLKTLSPIGDAMYVCDLGEYFKVRGLKDNH